MVASAKGVYISHIWDNPVFVIDLFDTLTTDEFFTANSFDVLRDGNQYAASITTLKETADEPGPLNSIYRPKVVMITPFPDLNDELNGITTKFKYQARAERLAQSLVDILPGSEGSGLVFGYDRHNYELSTVPFGWLVEQY